jgi:uncharacterized protein (TIGR02246 family)
MDSVEQVVRNVFRALDAHELDRVAHAMTADCEFLVPAASGQGGDAFIAWLEPFLTACPDIAHEIRGIAARGELVAIESRVTGTNTGPFRGPAGEIPPTGRAFELPAADIWRLHGNQIGSFHIYFDKMTFLGQLGLLPDPTPSA